MIKDGQVQNGSFHPNREFGEMERKSNGEEPHPVRGSGDLI